MAATGAFTGTLTGMASGTSGSVNYHVANGVCTLTAISAIVGTSNATAMTMTGLPSICQPATGSPFVMCTALSSNISNLLGSCQVTGGTITFSLLTSGSNAVSTTGFSSVTGKGIQAGWSITYPLD